MNQNEQKSKLSVHCCDHIGVTMDKTITEQLSDGTWKARSKIGTIFGAEVEGECEGRGATEQEALVALSKEMHDLSESLWA